MNEFKSFYRHLDRKFNTWCKYTKRLDTYGCGCQHECRYCYAKGLLNFRSNWYPQKPKIAYISEIENCISLLSKTDIVRLGGMTDCFQPLEKSERVTFKSIQLLNQYKINYLIVTKSNLVSSNEYVSIYDKELAHFQISITSTNDLTGFEYEKAPAMSERIKSIEKLYKLGFDVSIRLSPLIEKNINFNILNKIKCNKILIEFLKVNHWIRKSFNIDYSDYTLKYGGHDNLQLEKKINLVNKVHGFQQISVGEYVKQHYDYFRDAVNYNKDDCCNLNIKYSKYCHEGKQIELEL